MTMRSRVRHLAAEALAATLLVAAATAAQAQDKTIKIGALLPISGPGSYFGVQDKQGIELAIEQLNKAGVNGYKFEVKYEDSACSPLQATNTVKRVLEQLKPHVVIGEECSDASLAIAPILDQAKVPMLNAGSALLEAFRHDEAAESALSAKELAARCRYPMLEARAEWLLRAAA